MSEVFKSQEELEEVLAGKHGVIKLEAPRLYASSFSSSWTSNEVMLTCQRLIPVVITTDKGAQNAAEAEAVALLSMSPQSAKDLFLTLDEGLKKFEAENGIIITDHMRLRGLA